MIARLLQRLDLFYIDWHVKRLQRQIDRLMVTQSYAPSNCFDHYYKVLALCKDRDELQAIAADIRRGIR